MDKSHAVTGATSPRPLTAVIAGGTSGIGSYIAHALGRKYACRSGADSAGLRIYIIGRNEEKIVPLRTAFPSADIRFVKADLSLLRDVDAACSRIKEWEQEDEKQGGIDMLFMSQGEIKLGGRCETIEGIDQSMSLLYYSRLRLTINLLPLLKYPRNSSSASSHGSVISIYAAGLESSGRFYPSDLSLTQPQHYTFSSCRATVVYMKTFMFERLARENAGQVSFVHTYPSVVITPAYHSANMPWWFRALWSTFAPLVRAFIAVPAEESGDRHVSFASERYPPRAIGGEVGGESAADDVVVSTDGVRGGGAYALNQRGETFPGAQKRAKDYADLPKDLADRVWAHTMGVFEQIGAEGKAN